MKLPGGICPGAGRAPLGLRLAVQPGLIGSGFEAFCGGGVARSAESELCSASPDVDPHPASAAAAASATRMASGP